MSEEIKGRMEVYRNLFDNEFPLMDMMGAREKEVLYRINECISERQPYEIVFPFVDDDLIL